MAALSGRARQVSEDWMSRIWPYLDDNAHLAALVCGLAEVATHALAMPTPGYLPPLPSHMDAVAVGVGSALGAGEKAMTRTQRWQKRIAFWEAGLFRMRAINSIVRFGPA